RIAAYGFEAGHGDGILRAARAGDYRRIKRVSDINGFYRPSRLSAGLPPARPPARPGRGTGGAMKRWGCLLVVIELLGFGWATPRAQALKKISLKEAHAMALANHPQVSAAEFRASAAGQVPTELRSSFFPNVTGTLTGAGAEPNSRIAAGGLNNPVIFSRYANGLSV